jgi:hypothetical protein
MPTHIYPNHTHLDSSRRPLVSWRSDLASSVATKPLPSVFPVTAPCHFFYLANPFTTRSHSHAGQSMEMNPAMRRLRYQNRYTVATLVTLLYFTLLLHGRCIVGHSCDTIIALLLHSCYTAVTLLLHYCYSKYGDESSEEATQVP